MLPNQTCHYLKPFKPHKPERIAMVEPQLSPTYLLIHSPGGMGERAR